MYKHVRNFHPLAVENDGSCPEYGIPAGKFQRGFSETVIETYKRELPPADYQRLKKRANYRKGILEAMLIVIYQILISKIANILQI